MIILTNLAVGKKIMAEELFFKVEALLCKQDKEKLKLFAATLGIDGEQIKASKGRRNLKYIIIKVLDGNLDEEGKTDEDKCDAFKHMAEDLRFYNGDYEAAQADQKEDEKKNAIGADNNTDNDGQGNNFPLILRELNLRTSLLRKEFKIKGQIGEANQKDKLTYVSLMHQIDEVQETGYVSLMHQTDEAQETGYEESEIVSSVIRAMIPSLTQKCPRKHTKPITQPITSIPGGTF